MTLAAAPVSLPDVAVSRADIASVRGRLRSYQARYAPFFGRRELRGHARAYLRGLLSDEPRKSVERMVLRLRGADANAVRTQQLFLRKARWDDGPILAAHRELVAATLGGDEGVLAIDGTDIPKDGTESVGVARQYCGQLGKRANCQAAVYAAYLGRGGAALVDRRLYLNREWVAGAGHAERRRRTGVPEGTPFRTKPQLALDMLANLVAEGTLPVRRVTCDEGFGGSHDFLDGVADLGLGYLAEVPRNTHVWTTRPQRSGPPSRPVFSAPPQEAGAVADRLPRAAWRPFILREGAKGPPGRALRGPARDGPPRARTRPRRLAAAAPQPRHRGAQVPSLQRSGGDARGAAGVAGRPALADRAVLPRRQAALRAGGLRGPQLAGLAPPRHPGHAGPLLRGAGDAAAQKKHPGLTVPQTCLLVDAVLPRIGAPTDRACAIVDYRRAHNAAARRSHARRRRRYCEYLFRSYQVSLHY